MKKLLVVSALMVICYGTLFAAPPVSEYRGNYRIFGGVLVSSYSVDGIRYAPVISSTVYTNRTDETYYNDAGGFTVFIASYPRVDTTGLNAFKLPPGASISIGGRNIGFGSSVFARTLTGTTQRTTVWYIITGDDRTRY